MGFMDKVGAGLEQAAHEAEKAFDKGKTKVGELQVEMQLDGLAKKLGYMVFDFYRGREVDQTARQKVLDDMSNLEDRLFKIRAEAAAKAGVDTQARAARRQPPVEGSGAAETPGAELSGTEASGGQAPGGTP